MAGPNVEASDAARCLRILEVQAEPIVAAKLARQLHLVGTRETQRRHVRAIVQQLRDNGSMIVAVGSRGYYLTEDPDIWKQYLDGRQIEAKKVMGETHKRKKIAADSKGQGLLFKPGNIATGLG
ncbi:MAG: hypothetical protein KAT00_01630 [Planctomycetes bacterium]|nr:hypothetical protein [Planctomycetota bacterium]